MWGWNEEGGAYSVTKPTTSNCRPRFCSFLLKSCLLFMPIMRNHLLNHKGEIYVTIEM